LEVLRLPSAVAPGVAQVRYLSDPPVSAVTGPVAPGQPALIRWGDGNSSAGVLEPAGPGRVSVQVRRTFDGPREFQVTIILPAADPKSGPRVIRLTVFLQPPSPGGGPTLPPGIGPPAQAAYPPTMDGSGDVVTFVIEIRPQPTEQSPYLARRDYGPVRPALVQSAPPAPAAPAAVAPPTTKVRLVSVPLLLSGGGAPTIPGPASQVSVAPAASDPASRLGYWPDQPQAWQAPAALTAPGADQLSLLSPWLAEETTDPGVSPAGDRGYTAVLRVVSLAPETHDPAAGATPVGDVPPGSVAAPEPGERLIGQLAAEPLPEDDRAPVAAPAPPARARRWVVWLTALGVVGGARWLWRRQAGSQGLVRPSAPASARPPGRSADGDAAEEGRVEGEEAL
jgi:hypothetical protein